jgi:hypothetical protein
MTSGQMLSGIQRITVGWKYMLFLGLGTGLGSTFIVDGIVAPVELGHLPYRNGTFEDHLGIRGLEKHGPAIWRRDVEDVVARLVAACSQMMSLLEEAM